MLTINLLGPPEIYLDTPPNLHFRTRKAQALLIYLAVTGRRWSRDALATLFWPETDDTTARKNLRDILPSLRRQLDEYLHFDEESIGLDTSGPYKCDVAYFCAVLERPLPTVKTDRLAAILALYRGEFLEDYATSKIAADFELWALRERERLHQLALMGFTTLCRRQQESGAYEAALSTNRQLLKLAPWEEATHRQQMLLLAHSGQRAAALAHFDACCQILAEELDVEPDEETVALYTQIQAGAFSPAPAQRAAPFSVGATATTQPQTSTPPAGKVAIPNNLSAPLAVFVGRQQEITFIRERLATNTCRLLTIVGTGGMGKSSLALAAGQQLLAAPSTDFPDGIFWVPLVDINAATLEPTALNGARAEQDAVMGEAILRAIADQLSTQPQVWLSSIQQLHAYLRPRRLLLILDNLEQILAGTQALVTLLAQAPLVKILATSRARLSLRGEHLLPLDRLSLPTTSTAHTAKTNRITAAPISAVSAEEAWQASEAVAMFLQRAQQLDPAFTLDAETLAPVVQICQLVEGLPLGIELATSMLPLLSCQALAAELAESLHILKADTRDLPHEQRTLQAVFERSWRLLAVDEQQLLARLAVFPGSFQRDAAQQIAGATLPMLLRLVDQSLLHKNGENRYILHRTVQAFANQKLQQQPAQASALQTAYAHFYLEFLASKEDDLFGASHGRTIEQIQSELDNIHAAWRQAVGQQMIDELGRCLNAMYWFYEQQGFFLDAIEFCNQALSAMQPIYAAQPDKSGSAITRLTGRLQMFWGNWSLRLGQFQQAQDAYALSYSILQTVDDAEAMIYVLGFWGASLRVRDPQRSLLLLTEALHLAQAAKVIWMQVVIHQLIGELNLHSGNYGAAETSIKASQALTTAINWPRGLTAEHKIMGRICLARGNYRQAEEHLQQSIEIARHHHLNQFYLDILITLGEACRLQGRFAEAKARYAESHALAEALGGAILLSPILWEEGTLAVQCGDYQRAKTLFTGSLAMGLPNWWVHALLTLGWALIGLGELRAAQEYFQSVLADAQSKARLPIALEAQAGVAYLALLQVDADQINGNQIDESQYRATITQTMATLQQICRHPAATQQTRTQIDQLIATITLVR